ncbi:NEFM, partial [Symbiodinium pilosum]
SLLQSSHTLQSSATRGSMGQAVASAVLPLAATAYAFQLLAMRYFNADTVSYKGHGSRLADGAEFGTEVSSVRLVVKEMKRKRKEKARQLLNNNSQSFDVGTQRAWFSNIFFSPTSPTSPGQSNPQFELPPNSKAAAPDEKPYLVEYSESWGKVLESYM